MSDTPNLEGSIVINTQSVQRALESVRDLEKGLERSFGQGRNTINAFNSVLSQQSKVYQNAGRSLQGYSKEAQENTRQQQRMSNLIANAANKVAQYEASVRRSNATQSEQQRLITRASANLDSYSQAVMSGATGGQRLQNVNTQLNVSMGQLNRELQQAQQTAKEKAAADRRAEQEARAHEQAVVRQQQALSHANTQFEAITSQLRTSNMESERKTAITREVSSAHERLTSVLRNNSSTVTQVAEAQRNYREAVSRANIATREANREFRTAQAKKFGSEMRNLTGSVQVALGPLSGVASRLMALQGLFTRNAAGIAALLASFTGLTVLFQRAGAYAREAERELLQIEAAIDTLGDTAMATSGEIQQMSQDIAGITLLNESDVRQASSVMMQFTGIARNQMDEVILSAQGMATVFGGSVTQNVRRLGRAIQDPVDGMSRLRQSGIDLGDTVEEEINRLVRQGRQYEATSRLLDELTSLQNAAQREAEGLAGAYDAISDNLNVLFDELFNQSGALDAAADGVRRIADAVADLSESDEIVVIGQMFARMASFAGSSVALIVENINILMAVVVGLAASKIPRLLAAMVELGSFMKGASFAGAIDTVTSAYNKKTAAAASATVATGRFRKAAIALRGPLGILASSALAATTAYISLNSAREDYLEDERDAAKRQADRITAAIEANRSLNSEQVKGIEEARDADEQRLREINTGLSEREREERRIVDVLSEQINAGERYIKGPGGQIISTVTKRYEAEELARRAVESGNESLVRQGQYLQDILEAQENNTEEQRRLQDSMDATLEMAREMNGEMERASAADRYKASVDQLEELRKEFDRSAVEVENLESKLEQANDVWDTLIVTGKASVEELQQMGRVIMSIQEALDEATESTDEYADSIRGMTREFHEAGEDIENLERQLRGFSDQSESLDISRDVRDMAESLQEMDDEEVLRIARALDLQANSADQSRAAILRLHEANLEYERSLERQLEQQQRLDAHFDQTNGKFDETVQKYEELQEAALRSGDDERLAMLEKELQDELDLIDAHAERIRDEGFNVFGAQSIEEQFEQRRERMEELLSKERDDYKDHMKEMEEQERKAKVFQTIVHSAEGAEKVLGESMQAMQAHGKEQTREYQAMAAAQAVIAQGLAVSQAWADTSALTFEQKVAQSAAAAIAVGSAISQINSSNYADGGYVSGPGTSRSDSIPANLSDGEFVMNAASVRSIGQSNLERMNNSGRAPRNFASGGPVGNSSAGSYGGGSDTIVQIIDQRSGDASPVQTEESFDSEGRKVFKAIIRDTVKGMMNSGQMDRDITNNYTTRRKPKKR